jgi:hypothetical protein
MDDVESANPSEANNNQMMSTPEHKSQADAAVATSSKAEQPVYRLPRIIQLCQRYQFNREETEIFHLMVVSQVRCMYTRQMHNKEENLSRVVVVILFRVRPMATCLMFWWRKTTSEG